MPRRKSGSTLLSKRKSVKCCDLSELTKQEIEWGRWYAATLKATGHSWRYISDTLNIQGKLIRDWVDDPEWQSMVAKVADDVVAGALAHLNRAAVDLAEELLDLARSTVDDNVKLRAIVAGLDRVGLSAVNKSESKVTKTEREELDFAEGFWDRLEGLPVETQRQIAEMASEIDKLVVEAKGRE